MKSVAFAITALLLSSSHMAWAGTGDPQFDIINKSGHPIYVFPFRWISHEEKLRSIGKSLKEMLNGQELTAIADQAHHAYYFAEISSPEDKDLRGWDKKVRNYVYVFERAPSAEMYAQNISFPQELRECPKIYVLSQSSKAYLTFDGKSLRPQTGTLGGWTGNSREGYSLKGNIDKESISELPCTQRTLTEAPKLEPEPTNPQILGDFSKQSNEDRFTINRNNTVTDNKTDLIWERKISNVKAVPFSYEHCRQLNIPARAPSIAYPYVEGEWGVPSIEGLKSIVEKGVSPSIYHIAFPDTPAAFFWSYNLAPDGSTSGVDFATGKEVNKFHGEGLFRCVRSRTKLAFVHDPNRYVLNKYSDHRQESVTDTKTTLEWQRHPFRIRSSYRSGEELKKDVAQAENYCGKLEMQGKTDWRVPDIAELRSLEAGEHEATHIYESWKDIKTTTIDRNEQGAIRAFIDDEVFPLGIDDPVNLLSTTGEAVRSYKWVRNTRGMSNGSEGVRCVRGKMVAAPAAH